MKKAKALAVAGGVSAGLAGLYVSLLAPRRGAAGWEKFSGVRFAHRGLHDLRQGIPENSLPAFRRAAEKGVGSELDVHLMADGQLAVVHDSDLQRVCGKEGLIEELRREDILHYPLCGTSETIPLLREVLSIYAGNTLPLIIELKPAGNNAVALTDAVMAVMKDWDGTYCLESFQPAVLRRLRKQYPWVLRGQLCENFMKDSDLPWPVRFSMTTLLSTRFTRPDFIAIHYQDRNSVSLRLMRTLYGVHEVNWTIRDKAVMEFLETQGVTTIFEDFDP